MEEEEELDLDLEEGNTRNNNSVLSSSSTPRRPSIPASSSNNYCEEWGAPTFLSPLSVQEKGWLLLGCCAEVMEDVSRGFPDPFLDEMKRNTWEKSGRFLLVTEFQQVGL